MIDLDFRNYVLMMSYAARYMIDHGVKGGIVNITSSRGEQAYPGDGIYGGMKAALNRAIRSFAVDVCEYGIRINNVAPGAIRVRTKEQLEAEGRSAKDNFWDKLGPRIPLGRTGNPEDIGQAVAFLLGQSLLHHRHHPAGGRRTDPARHAGVDHPGHAARAVAPEPQGQVKERRL